MNKNYKNLFKWEGFKKEIWWILFIIFLLFITWSYKYETQICRDIAEDPEEFCLDWMNSLKTAEGTHKGFDVENRELLKET